MSEVLNNDYRDMLKGLLDNKVKFLIVGAYAMGAHGYPRATGDIDFWVEPSDENSKKVFKALKEFGAPLMGVDENSFTEKTIIYQIGIPPRRIDIIGKIESVEFDEAYEQRETAIIDGLEFPFISMNHLIKNKESTGRDKDTIDAKNLRKRFKI